MTWDPRSVLKIYNYVNDDKRPKVNIKFLALFAGLIVAGTALIAFAVYSNSPGTSPTAAPQSKTEYVGLTPTEIASGQFTPSMVEQMGSDWQAAHPNAHVQTMEPQYANGVLVGYNITYTEP